MLRQVSETVMINKEGKENVMNSKSEWNYINLPHVVVEYFTSITVLLNIPTLRALFY